MKKLLTASMIGLLVAAAPVTQALSYHSGHRSDVSPAQAMRIAEKAVGGKAYRAEPDHYKGRRAYSVDVRHARSVVKVEVDARNGKILNKTRQAPARRPIAHRPVDRHHR